MLQQPTGTPAAFCDHRYQILGAHFLSPFYCTDALDFRKCFYLLILMCAQVHFETVFFCISWMYAIIWTVKNWLSFCFATSWTYAIICLQGY